MSLLLRLFAIALVVSVTFNATLASAAKGNPRYASVVIDIDTGKVLSSSNADARRFPASLTKMMTLYMTFDALSKGKIKLSDAMPVSKNAAAQPQTNIALRSGDTLTVDQAIRALVTRSANDAAVVLAENLGKSTWNFALMSTNKARRLGMTNTVFRNPNGLPDPRQYTTANDMARLGIALRRDFPQYFHYFNIKNFAYKGRNYPTHNNVLYKFKGANGIKTGYIRASGFNLVSTVERDGHHVVGVVMGGVTAASRDTHMVQLLTQGFAKIETGGDSNVQYASAVPAIKPEAPQSIRLQLAATAKPSQVQPASAQQIAAAAAPKVIPVVQASNMAQPGVEVHFDPTPIEKPKPTLFSVALTTDPEVKTASFAQPIAKPEPPKPIVTADAIEKINVSAVMPARTPSATPAIAATTQVPSIAAASPSAAPIKAAPNTLDYQLAMLSTPFPVPTAKMDMRGRNWGIQVGAYSSADQARDAVNRAARNARSELANAAVAIHGEGTPGKEIHRARLGNLTRDEAAAACKTLNASRQPCFPLQIN